MSCRCVMSLLALALLALTRAQAELMSQWELDGTADAAVGTNHGTLQGNPVWAANRYGDPGKALKLDGQDDSVVCGGDASLSFGDGENDRPMSVCAWVKMDASRGFAVIKKVGEYYFDNNAHFRFHVQDESAGAYIGRSAGDLTPCVGKWVHLAATYDGSGSAEGITMYLNGAVRPSRGETRGNYVAMENLGGDFTLGRGWRHARGLIDDVRVYEQALTAEEVKDIADFFRGATALKPAASLAAADKQLTIPRTSVAPTVDGRLSDAVWGQARWRSDFCVHGSPQQPAVPKTAFAMVHNGDNLYVGVKADEPQTGKLRALVAERDGASWTDDSIEIFIDSKGDGQSHYHFAVNTRGVLHDSEVVRGGGAHRPDWNANAEVAANVGNDAYSLEVAIPLSALWFDPNAPTACRLNVTRSRFITGGRELAAYAPVRRTFHDTESFALAQIRDADLTPFLWFGLDLSRADVLSRKAQLVADVELTVNGLSSIVRHADVEATLRTADWTETVRRPRVAFAPGVSTHTISIPLQGLGEGTLDVALRDPQSSGAVRSRQFRLALDYQPLKVELRQPCYMNAIFADQELDELTLSVEAVIDPDEWRDYVFHFVLRSDRDILRHEEQVTAREFVVSVPLPSLANGRYRMQGRLVHRPSGTTLGRWSDRLRKLPPRKGEVRFDEHGVCLVDGKPFVPFGSASDWWPKGIWDAVDWGCNAIENCAINMSDKEMLFLDEVHRAGLKLLVYPYPKGFPTPIAGSSGPTGPLTAEQETALRTHVRKRMHHPAILAWYTGNEPFPERTPPATMEQIDRIIREEDPYHPTTIINHNIRHIAGNEDAMSLVMPDPYPGFFESGPWIRPDFPTQAVQEAFRASCGRKPVWAMLAAHDGTLFGHKGRRPPTFADLRNQLHQTVIAGAKGFFWYCRYWIEPEAEIALTYLAKEVRVLRLPILAPKSGREFVVLGPGERTPSHHLGRREAGNHTYLFAVSTSDKPRELAFRAAGLVGGRLAVVGEARTVDVRGGRFKDRFKPYDTHIYTTDARIADQLDMAPVLRDIETNANPPTKPDNLAWKGAGTTVTVLVTKQPQRCPPPAYMIDGSRWSSWRRGKLPQQVDVVFARSREVARVVIDSNISRVEIQAWQHGAWAAVAEAKSTRSDVRREVQTIRFSPVATDRLRLTAHEVRGSRFVQDTVLQVWGIEVYGEGE